jgi:hypothetical protein
MTLPKVLNNSAIVCSVIITASCIREVVRRLKNSNFLMNLPVLIDKICELEQIA